MPKVKYITYIIGKWVVRVRGKYLGRFSTLDEAIKVRDEYMKGMNEQRRQSEELVTAIEKCEKLEQEVKRLREVIRLARDTAYQATQDCPRCSFIDNILTKALNEVLK